MDQTIEKNLNILDTYVEDDVHTMDVSQLLDLLTIIENVLGLDGDDSNDKIFKVMNAHYSATGMNINPGAQIFSRIYGLMSSLMHRAHMIENREDKAILSTKCKDIRNAEMTMGERWNRDRTMLHYLDQFTKAHTMFRHCHINNGSYAENSTDIWSMDPYDPTNLDGCNDFQIALFATLRNIWEKRYRRYQTNICKEIKTSDGYNTRAWEVISSIEEFVYGVVNKEYQLDLWKKMTKQGSTIKQIAGLLEKQKDLQFPDIKKCRHLWSFKNGLFFGKQWSPEEGAYTCKFYPYDSNQCLHLDPTLVSAKYFDLKFEDHSKTKDWYNIPTPSMQQVLDYQDFPESQSRWMYIFAGRLCFDTGDMDRWQVIPFLKGIAKSGKSTLLTKVFKKFYSTEDISVLSNNIEKKFGLQAIYNSFMFIAPEIKGDLALDQAEFQSIVSGEEVSVARKNERAITIEWKSPGALAGNEIPNWKDNSGSIMRRIMPFDFMKQVKDADTDLELRLELELPAILEKCIRAYLETVKSVGKKDIWKLVPAELRKAQMDMAACTNVLYSFLTTNKVVYGNDKFVPWADFASEFKHFVEHDNSMPPIRKFTATNRELWIGPFQQKDLIVKQSLKSFIYNGKKSGKNGDWIIQGIDIIREDQQVTC